LQLNSIKQYSINEVFFFFFFFLPAAVKAESTGISAGKGWKLRRLTEVYFSSTLPSNEGFSDGVSGTQTPFFLVFCLLFGSWGSSL
jgi:hypothetical protein